MSVTAEHSHIHKLVHSKDFVMGNLFCLLGNFPRIFRNLGI